MILVAAAAWWWTSNPASITFARTPDQNILLVTIDTLRADALGSYGGAARTPALDRLAGGGVRYDFAHAHAVVTLPSHATILTGLYPYQHGIRDNSGFRLQAGTATVATVLKRLGFATAAFVGAFPLDARFGLNAGFDVYDDAYPESAMAVEFAVPERRADEVVALARRWIAAERGRWFLWVHLFDPHATYQPPPPFDARYPSDPYLGEVAYTDSALAPLFDDVRPQPRPTLAVVTGDHGEALGDHGEVTHGLFAYESTLRVPLILSQLGAGPEAARGVVSSLPARHVDIAPTILDIVQAAVPAGLPGRSLINEAGRPLQQDSERASYFEAMSASLNRGWAPLSGVLAGREKLISLPLPELYDLAEDPGERRSLIDARADRRRALESRLASFGAAPAGPQVAESPEVISRLRALGYVAGPSPRKSRYTEADDPKRLIDIDRAIHQGVELYQQKKPADAARLYAGIIARRPDMAIAYRHLAALQWEAGDPAAAVSTLERARTAGVADASMRAQLGIYLAEAGRPADAIPLLETTAEAPSSDVDAVNALGIAYARAGRLDEAMRAFERVVTLDPTNAMAFENIGSTRLRRGDVAGARAALTRALAINPRSARAEVGLGAVEMKAGDRDAALAHWRRAVELDSSDLEAVYNLATQLAAVGRVDEARRYADFFVRSAPPALYAREIAELRRIP
jgi:arylsulfatase A-like enzyme/Tfp pilus assembly protein PilF